MQVLLTHTWNTANIGTVNVAAGAHRHNAEVRRN